jgi:hypothetical protein
VTVTTLAGHVSTVAAFDCRSRWVVAYFVLTRGPRTCPQSSSARRRAIRLPTIEPAPGVASGR